MADEVCYRHPDRRAGVHCTRCGNAICPDCVIQAPIGHHCPACLADAGREARQAWRRLPFTYGITRRGLTVVVLSLAVVDIAVFVLSVVDSHLLDRYATSPAGVADGEWYRLVTAAFLHRDLTHLLLNLASLLVLGPVVEEALGRVRFLALYLLSAMGASTLSLSLNESGSIGASGALFGLVGAVVVLERDFLVTSSWVFGFIVAIGLLPLFVPDVDHAGHLGGLLTGLLLGLVSEKVRRPTARTTAELVAGLVVVVVAFGLLSRMRGSWPTSVEASQLAVLQQRDRSLQQFGPTDTPGTRGPLILPTYRQVKGGRVSYTVFAYRSSEGRQTLRFEFGDGESGTATVSAGSGIEIRRFSHSYPARVGRYQQKVTVVGREGWEFEATTDVCPRGPIPTSSTMPPGPNGAPWPVCVPLPAE